MKILTVLPIFKNNFQEPISFFSPNNFNSGEIILVPYGKKEKPALIIEVLDSKSQKAFLRQNKIPLQSQKNPFQIILFTPEFILEIKRKSFKINFEIKQSLEKLISKNLLKKLNNISEKITEKEIKNIQKEFDKIDTDFVNKKLKRYLPQKEKIIKSKGAQNIADLLKTTRKENTHLHSEKHFLVNEIREYFGEKTTKGKGSFSFYLGFFKKIPEATIYKFWSEVKESRLPITKQQKIFWWKIGKFLKDKK